MNPIIIDKNNRNRIRKSKKVVFPDKLDQDLILKIIKLSMFLAGEHFFYRDLSKILEKIEKSNLTTSVDHCFGFRRKYLELKVRYIQNVNRELDPFSIFIKLYPTKTVFNSSQLYSTLNRKSILQECKDQFKDCYFLNRDYIIKLTAKITNELELGDEIGSLFGKFVLKISCRFQNDDIIKNNSEFVIGCLVFILRLYYGIGVDFPSLSLLNYSQIDLFLDGENKKTLRDCLKIVEDQSKNSKLMTSISNIKPFISLIDKLKSIQSEIKDPCTNINSFKDIGNMTLSSLNEFLKDKHLGNRIKESSMSYQSKYDEVRFFEPSGEKPHTNVEVIEVEKEYDGVQKDDVLREELKEEIDFIQNNTRNEIHFEIPHPSDIFCRYKLKNTCPVDKIGIDYLILIEYLSVYFELQKEKLI